MRAVLQSSTASASSLSWSMPGFLGFGLKCSSFRKVSSERRQDYDETNGTRSIDLWWTKWATQGRKRLLNWHRVKAREVHHRGWKPWSNVF